MQRDWIRNHEIGDQKRKRKTCRNQNESESLLFSKADSERQVDSTLSGREESEEEVHLQPHSLVLGKKVTMSADKGHTASLVSAGCWMLDTADSRLDSVVLTRVLVRTAGVAGEGSG